MRPDRLSARASTAWAILLALLAGSAAADSWSEVDPGARQRAAAARLADLAFLTGSWWHETDAGTYEEAWTAPRGGMMLGVHRDVLAGREPSWEFLRIAEEDEGIVYWAFPGGSPPTPFRLVGLGEGLAVFANPDHDFPQRITYRRTGDELTARVEAQVNGESQGFEQSWTLRSTTP